MELKRNGQTIYLSEGNRLLICTRPEHKQSRYKGEFYLLKVDQTGKKTYVSSLWGTAPNFELEYKGIRYSLTIVTRKLVSLKAILSQGVAK